MVSKELHDINETKQCEKRRMSPALSPEGHQPQTLRHPFWITNRKQLSLAKQKQLSCFPTFQSLSSWPMGRTSTSSCTSESKEVAWIVVLSSGCDGPPALLTLSFKSKRLKLHSPQLAWSFGIKTFESFARAQGTRAKSLFASKLLKYKERLIAGSSRIWGSNASTRQPKDIASSVKYLLQIWTLPTTWTWQEQKTPPVIRARVND